MGCTHVVGVWPGRQEYIWITCLSQQLFHCHVQLLHFPSNKDDYMALVRYYNLQYAMPGKNALCVIDYLCGCGPCEFGYLYQPRVIVNDQEIRLFVPL